MNFSVGFYSEFLNYLHRRAEISIKISINSTGQIYLEIKTVEKYFYCILLTSQNIQWIIDHGLGLCFPLAVQPKIGPLCWTLSLLCSSSVHEAVTYLWAVANILTLG